jgi:ABC-type Na+ transport system ATPase subunit NatA
MIQVENLTKYFGPIMAIRNVSFEVDQGQIVGFLGPNGAGKTTTMRILTTYLPATSGIARVAGFDVMTESMEVRRNIGYCPRACLCTRRCALRNTCLSGPSSKEWIANNAQPGSIIAWSAAAFARCAGG